jgi:mono/diheme cytochrome c family protein
MIKRLMRTAAAGLPMFVLPAQQPASPAVYTADQAAAGRTAYLSSCVNCHTESLIPSSGAKHAGQEIPPLAGAAFLSRWGERTTSDLAVRIRTAIGGFPPKDLNDKTYLNLAAYVLQVNGARPGSQELTPATAVVIQTTTH